MPRKIFCKFKNCKTNLKVQKDPQFNIEIRRKEAQWNGACITKIQKATAAMRTRTESYRRRTG